VSKSVSFPSAKATRATAITLAFATWVLLLVGCMVHGTGSSLACPDWPTCYGTFFPEMKNGVEYEHTHRLVATSVGLITIVLSIMLILRRNADVGGKTTMKLGFLAFFLVVAQGVLGGITVLYQLPIGVTLAHLATSMCFFSLVTYIAMRTQPRVVEAVPSELGKLRPLAGAIAIATLAQIVLGGVVRHTHNGLACYAIPLCDGGQAWPAVLGKQIQMSHRYVAVGLACVVIALAVAVWRRALGFPRYRRLAFAAIVLVLAQIVLGLVSVAYSLPLWPVTAHLGVAALILVVHVALFVRLPRVQSASIKVEASGYRDVAYSGGE
jgi:heme A synthase